MIILTWNINGIRASKTPLPELLRLFNADIVCFQETKVTRSLLSEDSTVVQGYNSYFSISRVKGGYSGTATFVRDSFTPIKAEEGLSGCLATQTDAIGCHGNQCDFDSLELKKLDSEGRAVVTQHKVKDDDGKERLLSIINVYCPRADPDNEERLTYKLRFYQLLEARARDLIVQGSEVLIVGDLNVSHKTIDNCEPYAWEDFEDQPSRIWLTNLLEPKRFIDTFRLFHPTEENAFTCWCTVTGARANNYGTRIDYILASSSLKAVLSHCVLLPDIQGSDHCPVKAELSLQGLPANRPPSFCTRFWPEFAGQQQKLVGFFQKCAKKSESVQLGKHTSSEVVEASQVKRLKPGTVKQCSLLSFVQKVKEKPKELHVDSGQPCTIPEENIETCTLPVDMSKCCGAETGAQGFAVECSSDISSNQGSLTDSVTSLSTDTTSSNQICTSSTPPPSQIANQWKALFRGPPKAPLCKGHNEPSVLRTVKKAGVNKGRQFWVCNRADGRRDDPQARCDYFEWIKKS